MKNFMSVYHYCGMQNRSFPHHCHTLLIRGAHEKLAKNLTKKWKIHQEIASIIYFILIIKGFRYCLYDEYSTNKVSRQNKVYIFLFGHSFVLFYFPFLVKIMVRFSAERNEKMRFLSHHLLFVQNRIWIIYPHAAFLSNFLSLTRHQRQKIMRKIQENC